MSQTTERLQSREQIDSLLQQHQERYPWIDDTLAQLRKEGREDLSLTGALVFISSMLRTIKRKNSLRPLLVPANDRSQAFVQLTPEIREGETSLPPFTLAVLKPDDSRGRITEVLAPLLDVGIITNRQGGLIGNDFDRIFPQVRLREAQPRTIAVRETPAEIVPLEPGDLRRQLAQGESGLVQLRVGNPQVVRALQSITDIFGATAIVGIQAERAGIATDIERLRSLIGAAEAYREINSQALIEYGSQPPEIQTIVDGIISRAGIDSDNVLAIAKLFLVVEVVKIQMMGAEALAVQERAAVVSRLTETREKQAKQDRMLATATEATARAQTELQAAEMRRKILPTTTALFTALSSLPGGAVLGSFLTSTKIGKAVAEGVGRIEPRIAIPTAIGGAVGTGWVTYELLIVGTRSVDPLLFHFFVPPLAGFLIGGAVVVLSSALSGIGRR